MVQINPDQLFAMLGKLQAELMMLRDLNVELDAKNKALETQLGGLIAQAQKGKKGTK